MRTEAANAGLNSPRLGQRRKQSSSEIAPAQSRADARPPTTLPELPMTKMTTEQRLAILAATTAVRSGHPLMAELAAKLAADPNYDVAKAQGLLETVAQTHGLGSPDNARAARLAEIRGTIPPHSRPAAKLTLAELSGDPVRDARMIELTFVAMATSRRHAER